MGCSSCGKRKDQDMGESPTFRSSATMEMAKRTLTSEGPVTESLGETTGMIDSLRYVHGPHQTNPKTKKHLQRLARG